MSDYHFDPTSVHTLATTNVAVQRCSHEGNQIVVKVPDAANLVHGPIVEDGKLVIIGQSGGGDITGSLNFMIQSRGGTMFSGASSVIEVLVPQGCDLVMSNVAG